MFNKINVSNAKEKQTIYEFLKGNNFSENYIKNLRKKEGYIKVNGITAFTNAIISNGDIIELFKNPNTTSGIMQNIIPLSVVYEDDDILVVNKPSGMPSIPSRKHLDYNLAGAVKAYMFDKNPNFVVRIINRLDKDTSGLVCIAKHSYIANLLNSNKYINKTYYAICEGICNNITIDNPIITTKNSIGINNQRREISPVGKPAITYIKQLKTNNNKTLCEITLQYGRTHQIRVHMSSIGHPLLGDELYGNKSDLIDHTALCCSKMSIFNPITKKDIILEINIPDDMNKAFD